MDIPFDSFVSSQPFQFLVGPDAKPFYIHSALVEYHSKTLGTLIGGKMVEAEQGSARLDDIDEKTFLRFSQYAYTGDYSDPGLDVIVPQSDIALEDSENAYWGVKKDKKGKKNKVANLYDVAFSFNNAPTEDVCGACGRACNKGAALWSSFKGKAGYCDQPDMNQDPRGEFTSVFLCHANLYVFADRYGIGSLANLGIDKLRLALCQFTLHQQRTNDIIELVKYTYDNTPDRDESIDQLRDLVSDYVVCHLEQIVKNKGFSELMQQNGDVVKDLMPKITQRLN